MNTIKKRPIEQFELSPSYYIESYENGNKSHVKEELAELFLNYPSIAMDIILELPKELGKLVINSEYFQNAEMKMTINVLKNN
jgi:hypothetical protein